jgi:DNA-binding GntR family transcriptional regulator
MKTELVEIYSDASNLAVIRHPNRRFPGVLIQGDSLFILVEEAKEILQAVRSIRNEDLVTVVEEHLDKLKKRLDHYEEVLAKNGIELPY